MVVNNSENKGGRPRKKLGRPTVMTPEVIEKLESAFLLGCTDNEACFIADISPAALYQYQEANPIFTERKLLLKENQIYLARESVAKGIKRDPKLALSFLERKLKSEFSLRTELTGADGKDLTPISIDSSLLGKFSDASTTQSTAKNSKK